MRVPFLPVTLLAVGVAMTLGASPSWSKTYPAGGSVSSVRASKAAVAPGEAVELTVSGTGKCAVQLQGFPNANSPMLRAAGQLPMHFSTSIAEPGTYQVAVDLQHDSTDPFWCTGTAMTTLVVKAAAVNPARVVDPSILDRITVPLVEAPYDSDSRFSATLADGSGHPVANTLVTFKVGGTTIGSAKTNANGYSELMWHVMVKPVIGTTIPIDVTAGGTTGVGQARILRGDAGLTINHEGGYFPPGAPFQVVGKLVKAWTQQPLGGATIAIIADGRQVATEVTDPQGNYKYRYVPDGTAPVKMQAKFGGDELWAPATGTMN
jgi:hypothetical protein